MQIRDEIAKAKKRKEAEKSTAETLRHSAEELSSLGEASGARATSTYSINKSPIQPFKIINVDQHFLLYHFFLVTFLYGIGITPKLK
jgi:hypothetical protein